MVLVFFNWCSSSSRQKTRPSNSHDYLCRILCKILREYFLHIRAILNWLWKSTNFLQKSLCKSLDLVLFLCGSDLYLGEVAWRYLNVGTKYTEKHLQGITLYRVKLVRFKINVTQPKISFLLFLSVHQGTLITPL